MFNFFSKEDKQLYNMLGHLNMAEKEISLKDNSETEIYEVACPDDEYAFLHEAAIIEYHGTLFAAWYNCEEKELIGPTPIRQKRSKDGGKTWSDIETVAEDQTGKILFCPPVYGICEDKLYMLINEMVSADHIHALDLYVFQEEKDCFEFLWSKPIPFKLNTNVYKMANGKLLLPGRIAELDGFPNTPAVLISDSGKIDDDWRLVYIQENGDLPDGSKLVHPEITAIIEDNKIAMFSRDDERKVPLVYLSQDYGETWSDAFSYDIPFSDSKIYIYAKIFSFSDKTRYNSFQRKCSSNVSIFSRINTRQVLMSIKFHKNPVFLWFLILVRNIRNDFLFKRSLIGISCPFLCAYKINISFRHIDKQHHFPSIPFSHFDHDFLLLYFSSFHR